MTQSKNTTKGRLSAQHFIGQTFNRLTVIGIEPIAVKNLTRWTCYCICGTVVTVNARDVCSGNTTSCGCRKRSTSTTHGESFSSEYGSWKAMIQRCTNPKRKKFEYYGGQGVQVCERWYSFENFLQDMGKKPSPKHSLDRWPNPQGDYEPGNVRWATREQQSRNTSANHNVTYEGVTKCLMDWSKHLGIPFSTLAARLKRWTLERAMTTPRTTVRYTRK